jgi:hypothetical protein
MKSDMSVAILIEATSLDWFKAGAAILRFEKEAGHEVQVIDLSPFSWPRLGRYRMLGSKISRYSSSAMNNKLLESQVNDIAESLSISVLRTTSRGPMRRLVNWRIGKSVRELWVLLSYLSEKYDKVYVPNGRFPVARLSEMLQSRWKLIYFEIGDEGDAEHVTSQYPIHDRVSRQSEFNRMELDSQTVKKLSDAWLKPRVESNSSVNAFASRWKDSAEVKRFTNVFFTSSSDEYWALGTKWQEDSWLDQYEAFDAILSELETLGESSFAIRVHPNLINKSVGHFVRESDRLKWITARHPSLVIFMPHDSVNSYKLLEHSTRVFVSMSTIGLEASASGKSVWATSANSYDLVSDIRRIFSREDLSPSHLETWTVDMAKARKFIAARELGYVPSGSEIPAQVQKTPPITLVLDSGLFFLFIRMFARVQNFTNLLLSRFSVWQKN